MKYIIVVFIIAITLLFITGCSKSYEEETVNFLKEKYHENFTYIKEIDRAPGGSWISHHLKSENDENIIVNTNKKTKEMKDNYYKTLKKKEIIDYIRSLLERSSNFRTNNYKFFVDDNSAFCDNTITPSTRIEDALDIDKDCELIKYVDVYLTNEISIIKDNIIKELEDKNINIRVYAITSEEFNIFNSDNKYIYDYIETNDISSGTNSKYINIRGKNIYTSK
jgi:hypothetical protein